MRSSKSTVKGRKRDTGDTAVAAVAVTAVALIVLVKLAFFGLVGWGIFELVTWITSK